MVSFRLFPLLLVSLVVLERGYALQSSAQRLLTKAVGIRGGASFQPGSFQEVYARGIERRPILTKSLTASIIFGLSDYLAQRFENTGKKYNWTRTATSMAVGLFYFGPAAHYWYEMIFRLLPGTSLLSTLQKAALGQLIFGPSFTCIFFATSLMQSGSFSIRNWINKIRQDLPGAWLAGASFWPLVDLVSYSLISKDYIPLFVNVCSLVWTIYLSVIANRR